MQRMILSLLLKDTPRVKVSTIVSVLKSIGIDVEETYFMGHNRNKDTVLIEYILENIIEKQLVANGYEATSERVDYIVDDLMKGDKFNEPFVEMLNEYVNNAVIDKKIELEGLETNAKSVS